MATKTIEKPETEEVIERKPLLKADDVEYQSEGFCWREAFVRLPANAVLQDLNDMPEMWKNIQGNATKALRKWDRVRCVSYDESWFADAVVSHADRTKVILCDIRKVSMPKRDVGLYEDAMYRCEWLGTGYGVTRKSDGVRMGNQTWQNPEAARAFLLSQYPAKVA